jgi:transcriptional regulator with XRE-family HTH domain
MIEVEAPGKLSRRAHQSQLRQNRSLRPGRLSRLQKDLAEIGAQLRQRRELLSLTADEVERHTHVRVSSILALESGDFNRLSSAVQTRGMLANYATFLDLDADTLLLRYADALQASHRARHPFIPGKVRVPLQVRPNMPPLRSFMAGDVVFGLADRPGWHGVGGWALGAGATRAATTSISVLAARALVQQVTLIQ